MTKFDLLCGVCSVIAIGVWLAAGSPSAAILFAALGDGFASLPTIYKAWKHPETESGIAFIAGFISTLLVLPSTSQWDIANSAFQIYLLVINPIIIFAIYRKRFRFAR